MKKNFTHLLVLAFTAVFTGCSSDDDKSEQNSIAITLQEKYETTTFSVADITAAAEIANPAYEWVLTKILLTKRQIQS